MPAPADFPNLAVPENCAGRTFVVTGATSGFGREAARALLAGGAARVILAGRDRAAGEKAAAELASSTAAKGVVEHWDLDLESYASVRAFAARANGGAAEGNENGNGRLDALIANAGMNSFATRRAEGHVNTATVNVLSTFLLVALLLPALRRTAREHGVTARVTVVGSSYGFMMYKGAWEAVADDPLAKLDAMGENVPDIYPLTKIMDILFARRLGAALPLSSPTGGGGGGGDVAINVVCPGFSVNTGLYRSVGGFIETLRERQALFGRSNEQGSRTLTHGALAGAAETHGRYLANCAVAENEIPDWITPEAEQRTWEVVSAELEKVQPGWLESLA